MKTLGDIILFILAICGIVFLWELFAPTSWKKVPHAFADRMRKAKSPEPVAMPTDDEEALPSYLSWTDEKLEEAVSNASFQFEELTKERKRRSCNAARGNATCANGGRGKVRKPRVSKPAAK